MADTQPTPPLLRKQFPHEYNCWKAMRNRCANPGNASHRYYGAAGITVCTAWRESFAAFLENMGPAPSPRHQIERRENGAGYFPENCRWATPAEQQANTSKVRFLTVRGVTRPAQDWCRLMNLPMTTLKCRLDRLNWDTERAVLTPVRSEFRPKRHRGRR